jgi:hypothetical protein
MACCFRRRGRRADQLFQRATRFLRPQIVVKQHQRFRHQRVRVVRVAQLDWQRSEIEGLILDRTRHPRVDVVDVVEVDDFVFVRLRHIEVGARVDIVVAMIDVAVGRECMQLQAADVKQVVDVLERLADVENMLGRSEVGNDVVLADVGQRIAQIVGVIGARIAQVERPITVASEDRIERALRVRPGLRLIPRKSLGAPSRTRRAKGAAAPPGGAAHAWSTGPVARDRTPRRWAGFLTAAQACSAIRCASNRLPQNDFPECPNVSNTLPFALPAVNPPRCVRIRQP